MRNVEELEEKIFFELKNALDNLAKITSKEELLAKQELFGEIADRLAFLRILDKNREHLIIPQENSHTAENPKADDRIDADIATMQIVEEEVIYTNEINEIPLPENSTEDHKTDIGTESDGESEHSGILAALIHDESPKEHAPHHTETVAKADDRTYEERVAAKEKELQELEERRRKIVDFSRDQAGQKSEQIFHDTPQTPKPHAEKKFKLASIKGLKAMQNLFDEDPLEKAGDDEVTPTTTTSGSLKNSNIPTDYMEAPKKQPEFRIDFNDKVAFTKLLFAGNEDELRATIAHLNTFDHLEEAKQYLSELYYQKEWQKVDEYAQRLWDLVESKFL